MAKDQSLDQWKGDYAKLQKALEEKEKLLTTKAKAMVDHEASTAEQIKLQDHALQELSKKIERLEHDIGKKTDKINYLMARGTCKYSSVPPISLIGLFD